MPKPCFKKIKGETLFIDRRGLQWTPEHCQEWLDNLSKLNDVISCIEDYGGELTSNYSREVKGRRKDGSWVLGKAVPLRLKK